MFLRAPDGTPTAGDAAATPAPVAPETPVVPADTSVVDDPSFADAFSTIADMSTFEDEEPTEVQPAAEKPAESEKPIDPQSLVESSKTPETEAKKPEEPAKPEAQKLEPVDVAAQALAMKQRKDAFIADIEKTIIITDEEREQLVTEPHIVIPRLLARQQAETFEAVTRTIAAQLPVLVNGVLETRRRLDEGAEKFFGRWPELKAHEEATGQVGKLYRQLNPDATVEQAIEDIGMMAMLKLGLQPTAKGATASPPTPAAVPVPRPPIPPAAATGGGGPAPTAPTPNVWAEMADLQED